MAHTTALYAVPRQHLSDRHVSLALRLLARDSDHLVVITSATEQEVREQHPDIPIDDVVIEPQVDTHVISGLRTGVLDLLKGADVPIGTIVISSANVIGPLGGLARHLDAAGTAAADIYAAYWSAPDTDTQTGPAERVPYLDFTVFSDRITATPGFAQIWEEIPAQASADLFVEEVLYPFANTADQAGWHVAYPDSVAQLRSSNPQFFEPAGLIARGSPALPLSLFHIDPLLHDMNTIELKPALDLLRERYPEHYDATMAFALKQIPMRDLVMIADEYAIPADHATQPDKTDWAFGTVAVFLHAYYTDMMPHFSGLIGNIPAPVHLFVSTATDKGADEIRAYLKTEGWAEADFDVRVVAQNRGRDMSSLFITWRDVILSQKYELALRLHSKRTPQVPPQVGESFKAHLFDNLIGSRGYVSNLLDRIEAEPDIGLIVPPIIHIGFATLGHSWFNNKGNVAQLCHELGLKAPLDDATPVTPYGTMFWFRTKALRPMFAHQWKWQDYNAEPHHFDGGLAHSQERLIGYCTQAQGFRTLQVMCPEQAVRNYAKLEYKLQRLASHLPLGNIVEQDRLLRQGQTGFRGWLFISMRGIYAKMLSQWPWTRRYLRPVAHWVARLLAPSPYQP